MSDKLTHSGLSVSETGLKLIKAFEGYRPVDRELVTGQRVVGYGHRLYSDDAVMLGKREAEDILRSDLEPFEDMINSEVHAPMTQSQFDALCSFAFNIGPKAFLTSDTLCALNNGRPLDAANGLDIWRKSEIAGKTYVVDALMRRRTAEKALFLRTERNLPAGRVDLPPVRDTTIASLSTEDALPVFSADDTNGIVATAPHEVTEPKYRRREDGSAGALQLSELDILREEASFEDAPERPRVDNRYAIELGEGAVDAKLSVEPVEDVVQAVSDQTTDIDLSADLLANLPSTEFDILDDKTESLKSDLESDDLNLTDLTDAVQNDDMPKRQSPIAAAASDIVARLDALIDDADARFEDRDESWPESLITSEEIDETDVDSLDQLDDIDSAPSAEVVHLRDREPRQNERKVTLSSQAASASTKKPIMVIDELAQDDAFRVRNDSAAKYIQTRTPERQAPIVPTESGPGLWIPVLLGFLLVGLAGGTMISGAEALLGVWGPIIAFTGFVIGLALIMAGVYAALRMNLRD